ncbi:MAG: hypothetical protein NW206_07550 [Hyphomonadaceae bacterium]|nr:hypothetical protein [Hyphomonadaceae bacterium]
MKKFAFIGLLALAAAAPAFAQEAAAPVEATVVTVASAPQAAPLTIERREMVLAASGARVGDVISLNADGSPRVIFEQKVVSIPLSTLSRTDGRLVTSLSFRELRAMQN